MNILLLEVSIILATLKTIVCTSTALPIQVTTNLYNHIWYLLVINYLWFINVLLLYTPRHQIIFYSDLKFEHVTLFIFCSA